MYLTQIKVDEVTTYFEGRCSEFTIASAAASSLPAWGISSWSPLPTEAGCLAVQMVQILMQIRISRMT